ncbi:MAG: bacterial transcriptional activator domain-containing protein, partial [Anaerolineales bacterium]|nr:bacterial transcriptional activator domain-containing protein [Anaerolineales bacterium]
YVLDGGEVSSQELRTQFWPDKSRRKQIENMHSAVHAIRDGLGSDVIATNSNGYAAGEGVRLDAAAFERAAALALRMDSNSPEAKQVTSEALELFKGEFLPQFDSEWVLDRRRQLNEQFIRLAERYGELVSDKRGRLRAIDHLEAAVRLDPYRETLQIEYLEKLAEEGRFHEVKIQAARYRRKLAEELQLKPSQAFERRYRELLADRSTSHPLARLAS